MERRLLVIGLVAVALEASRAWLRPLPPLSAPRTVADWTLAAPETGAPRIEYAKRSWRWSYRGPVTVTVTIHEMVNDPKAFDTLQGWRVRPHEAAFHKGRYFAVVESPGAGLPALNRFVTALEAALPPGR